jgi:hypothetical protein
VELGADPHPIVKIVIRNKPVLMKIFFSNLSPPDI